MSIFRDRGKYSALNRGFRHPILDCITMKLFAIGTISIHMVMLAINKTNSYFLITWFVSMPLPTCGACHIGPLILILYYNPLVLILNWIKLLLHLTTSSLSNLFLICCCRLNYQIRSLPLLTKKALFITFE